MPTKNGDIGHNFNWHARAAYEAIDVLDAVRHIYHLWAVEGPFVYDAYGHHRPVEEKPLPTDSGEQIGAGFSYLFQGMAVDPAAIDSRIHGFSPTKRRFIQEAPMGSADIGSFNFIEVSRESL